MMEDWRLVIMTDSVFLVLINDYSDYIAQTCVDSVWRTEGDAYNRKEALNKEFDSDEYEHYDYLALFKYMEII